MASPATESGIIYRHDEHMFGNAIAVMPNAIAMMAGPSMHLSALL